MIRKLLPAVLVLLLISGCQKQEIETDTDPKNGCDIIEDCSDGSDVDEYLSFKEAYEALNGTVTSTGEKRRSVSIPIDHPFVRVEADEIVRMIENKETFYVYVGDELCPWCRSVIEKAIEVAKEAEVATIYYVKIWDSEGNEILRDRYVLEDGKAVLSVEGKKAYQQLLGYWDELLEDYTLSDDEDKEIMVGEKRIYIPNFIYVNDGQIEKLISGISDRQEGSRDELTPEILADEEEMFRAFFGLK